MEALNLMLYTDIRKPPHTLHMSFERVIKLTQQSYPLILMVITRVDKTQIEHSLEFDLNEK